MSLPPAEVPAEIVECRILLIRGRKVMLDRDLAQLYGIKPKRLNEQVKRNRERFPDDFMFRLTLEEGKAVLLSRSQFATLKRGGNIKYQPYVFTEQGIAMLSSVLKSRRAVQVNILIMRVFVKLREMMASHQELARRVEELERKYGEHDETIQDIFRAIKNLLALPEEEKSEKQMGFLPGG